MMKTRAEIAAARHPDCVWTEQAMLDAIEVRYPGGAPVDLVALCVSWRADATLSHSTLAHGAILVAKLAGLGSGADGAFLNPKKVLRALELAIP